MLKSTHFSYMLFLIQNSNTIQFNILDQLNCTTIVICACVGINIDILLGETRRVSFIGKINL